VIETRAKPQSLGAVDPQTCLAIQCGAISQQEAGLDTLLACSQAGYVGAIPWTDPRCEPFGGGPGTAFPQPPPEPEAQPEPAPEPEAAPDYQPAPEPEPAPEYQPAPEPEPAPEYELIGTPGEIETPPVQPAQPALPGFTWETITSRLSTVPWWAWLVLALLAAQTLRRKRR